MLMAFWIRIRDKLQAVLVKLVNIIYERYMRIRLQNKDFTILCSNCMGGIIYHRLGLQFRSPTVNLWMRQRDFLKLAMKPREYMDEKLVFIESEYSYPVAQLGDIKIYFNHSKDEETARKDWERRKKRINYDNLFLIMFDRENLSDKEILILEDAPCKGKIVLSPMERKEIPFVKTIVPKNRPMGKQYHDKDWFGLRTFEKHFDFVRWLNQ